MRNYNDIGIDSNVDRNRIRKLFIIGLIGGCMTFAGDWLLGCMDKYREYLDVRRFAADNETC